MSSTSENLQEAFAGESQANQKYRAFAKMAEKEGLSNIAKLFRTTAEAERIHAEGHLKALDHVGSTVDNLQAAIDGFCPAKKNTEFRRHLALQVARTLMDDPSTFARMNALWIRLGGVEP